MWVETDHDGIYEPLNGEVGVAGVSAALLAVNLGNGVGASITTTTGADGGYAFTSLPAGSNYSVQVIDTFGILTGYSPTLIVGGTADNTNKGQPYTGDLPADNSINMTADFGYFLPGAAIGDYVWYDADNDGRQDVGEPGIGNVTIALWRDTNGNGIQDTITDTVVSTIQTDANGGYLFTDLPAGTYFVDVTDTKGVLAGYSPSPSGFQSQPDPFKVVLTTSQVVNNADFGYVWPPTSGTAIVGDTVWWDTNRTACAIHPNSASPAPGAAEEQRRDGHPDDDHRRERQLPLHQRGARRLLCECAERAARPTARHRPPRPTQRRRSRCLPANNIWTRTSASCRRSRRPSAARCGTTPRPTACWRANPASPA